MRAVGKVYVVAVVRVNRHTEVIRVDTLVGIGLSHILNLGLCNILCHNATTLSVHCILSSNTTAYTLSQRRRVLAQLLSYIGIILLEAILSVEQV